MIPSRPLNFPEIVGQTFSLFGQTIPRYLILFILFFLPGAIIATIGFNDTVTRSLTILQHESGFSDNDLVILRNQFVDSLAKDNPAFRRKVEDIREQDSSARALQSQNADSVLQRLRAHGIINGRALFDRHIHEVAGPVLLLLAGGLLLLIGWLSLATTESDLGCQAFEERDQNLRATLAATLSRHLWVLLLLYVIYLGITIVVSGVIEGVTSLSNTAGALMDFVTFVLELYLGVRLAFTVPALVSEELGPIRALRRSWQLTSGGAIGWLRVFGIMVGFSLIFFLMGLAVMLVTGLFVGLSGMLWWQDMLYAPHITVAGLLGGLSSFLRSVAVFASIPMLLLFPLLPLFLTVVYYDLRTRHDGPLVYHDPNGPQETPELQGAGQTRLWQP